MLHGSRLNKEEVNVLGWLFVFLYICAANFVVWASVSHTRRKTFGASHKLKEAQESLAMSATSSFEYTFVSPVPDEYVCPICNCPMREPVQTKCGHRFCKHCLGEALKRNPECPIDRTPLKNRRKKNIYPDVASGRTILDFQVKCSNEGHGCRWIGELRSAEEHVTSCLFVRVRCTNEGCEAILFKGDLQNHLTNECTKRILVCEHCRTSYIWCLRKKHFKTCENFPCPCLQNCGQEDIPRNKMNDHIQRVCPRTEVSCTYSHVGCQAKVQRQVFLQHMKDNFEFHLTLACEKIQVLQAEVVSMKKGLEEVSAAFVANESFQELWKKVHTLNEKMRTIWKEVPRKEDISELSKQFCNLEEGVTATNHFLQNLGAQIASGRISEGRKLTQIMRSDEETKTTLRRLHTWQSRSEKARKQLEIEVETQKQKQTELFADYHSKKRIIFVILLIAFLMLWLTKTN